MKVSVITVCYNSEKTIERTLQSVISQTYKNIEYIVIDGLSSDETMQIVKKYKSSISQIVCESDTGIYDAMNKGFQKATGNVICFLNSDDIYASTDVINYVVNEMQSKNLDALFGGVSFFKYNNSSKVVRKYTYTDFQLKNFAMGWMPAHPSTFLSKNLIKKNGFFDSSFKIAGDFEYLLRLWKNLQFNYECTSKILVNMQTGGISNKNTISKLLLNKEILNACKKNGIKTNIVKIYLRYPKKILEYIFKN